MKKKLVADFEEMGELCGKLATEVSEIVVKIQSPLNELTLIEHTKNVSDI